MEEALAGSVFLADAVSKKRPLLNTTKQQVTIRCTDSFCSTPRYIILKETLLFPIQPSLELYLISGADVRPRQRDRHLGSLPPQNCT